MKRRLFIFGAGIAGLVALVLVPAASGAAPKADKGGKGGSTVTTVVVTTTTATPAVGSNTPDLVQPGTLAAAAAVSSNKKLPNGCPSQKPNCKAPKCDRHHKPGDTSDQCPSQESQGPGSGGNKPPQGDHPDQPSQQCQQHATKYNDARGKYNANHKNGDYNRMVNEHRWMYEHGCKTPDLGQPADPTVIVG